MNTIQGNTSFPGDDHNYVIAGNISNSFALGNVGSEDDFFLVGSLPDASSPSPILTGNFFAPDGTHLFRLLRNKLIINPADCSQIYGDNVWGYEICYPASPEDPHHVIFRVTTKMEKFLGYKPDCYATTLEGNFYNKHGQLVFSAHSGGEEEKLEESERYVFGISPTGDVGFTNMTEEDANFAAIAIKSNGAIHERLSGSIVGKTFNLDGKALVKAYVSRCEIHITNGNFSLTDSTISDCKMVFHGPAANILALIQANGGS